MVISIRNTFLKVYTFIKNAKDIKVQSSGKLLIKGILWTLKLTNSPLVLETDIE